MRPDVLLGPPDMRGRHRDAPRRAGAVRSPALVEQVPDEERHEGGGEFALQRAVPGARPVAALGEMQQQPGLGQDRRAPGAAQVDRRIEREGARDPVEHPGACSSSSPRGTWTMSFSQPASHTMRVGKAGDSRVARRDRPGSRGGSVLHQRRAGERDLQQEEAVEAARIDLDPRAVGDEVDAQAAEGRGMVPGVEERGAGGIGEDEVRAGRRSARSARAPDRARAWRPGRSAPAAGRPPPAQVDRRASRRPWRRRSSRPEESRMPVAASPAQGPIAAGPRVPARSGQRPRPADSQHGVIRRVFTSRDAS